MGNQKFKLSDMIPNAWFFKLKDMTSKPPPKNLKKHRLPPPPPPSSSPPSSTAQEVEPQCHPRKSYHIARDPPISPPRKSKTRKHHSSRRNPTAANHHRQFSLSSSASTTCTCRTTTTTTDDFLSPTITDEPQKPEERFDIVIDVSKSYGFDIELPRIATKPTITKPTKKISPNSKDHHQPKVISRSPPSRRFLMSSSSGVRLKVNSPKIMARKQGQSGNLSTGGRKSVSGGSSRRSISESFAVVKSSRDPQKDFRESMVEMIVQNNLRASKDLEDLLACYLSLNSDEYHDLIIKVFKQIWFDLIHHRPHKQVVSS